MDHKKHVAKCQAMSHVKKHNDSIVQHIDNSPSRKECKIQTAAKLMNHQITSFSIHKDFPRVKVCAFLRSSTSMCWYTPSSTFHDIVKWSEPYCTEQQQEQHQREKVQKSPLQFGVCLSQMFAKGAGCGGMQADAKFSKLSIGAEVGSVIISNKFNLKTTRRQPQTSSTNRKERITMNNFWPLNLDVRRLRHSPFVRASFPLVWMKCWRTMDGQWRDPHTLKDRHKKDITVSKRFTSTMSYCTIIHGRVPYSSLSFLMRFFQTKIVYTCTRSLFGLISLLGTDCHQALFCITSSSINQVLALFKTS